MNKIREIVSAWSIAIKPSEEQKQKAEARYAICCACEHKKENHIGLEFCGACGCPLKGKVFTPLTPEQGNCPKNKWKV